MTTIIIHIVAQELTAAVAETEALGGTNHPCILERVGMTSVTKSGQIRLHSKQVDLD